MKEITSNYWIISILNFCNSKFVRSISEIFLWESNETWYTEKTIVQEPKPFHNYAVISLIMQLFPFLIFPVIDFSGDYLKKYPLYITLFTPPPPHTHTT